MNGYNTKRSKHIKPLEGTRFGRLTVLSFLGTLKEGKDQRNIAYWLCKCDCGNTKECRAEKLNAGMVKSCGCLLKEHRATAHKAFGETPHNLLPPGEAAFRKNYRAYKAGAERRGYSFDLGIEEFRILTTSNCYYCDAEPSMVKKNSIQRESEFVCNGIDRKNNQVGYDIDNCIPCCTDCNFLKRERNIEDFLSKIKSIYENPNLGMF